MVVMCVVLGTAFSYIAARLLLLWFEYSRWWHRWRKYQYRVIQSTVVSSYGADPRTYYIIQRRSFFGWRDNPDVPGYDTQGKFAIYRTYYYDSFEEAEKWMDGIVSIMNSEAEKRSVRRVS